ncbi:MAG: MlaD family protein [Candidatus Hydrogenedentes bacterium]|nr:MlaD family protein [Candidatus Hydrogenedentota bacterium]
MATRKQKIQVLVFLLICSALILLIVYFVSGMYATTKFKYWIEFDESVLGIYEGGVVEYLGVPVGKVEEIKVSRAGKPLVIFSIDTKKVVLRQGVEASLVIYSLAAGTMAISLRGGDPDAPELPPGSRIPARRSTISAVSNRIEELMEDLKKILDTVKVGLEGMESGQITDLIENIKDTVEDTRELLAEAKETFEKFNVAIDEIKPQLTKVMEKGEDVLDEVKKVSTNANQLITSTKGKMEKLEFGKMQEKINTSVDKIGKLAEELKELSEQASYKTDNFEYLLRNTLREVNGLLISTRELVESLKQNPSTIIRGKSYQRGGR